MSQNHPNFLWHQNLLGIEAVAAVRIRRQTAAATALFRACAVVIFHSSCVLGFTTLITHKGTDSERLSNFPEIAQDLVATS